MMQANELRIGNIVYPFINSAEVDDHTFVTIIEIGEVCKVDWDSDIVYRHLGDLHPIPLTEEWLKRLGFSYRSYKGGHLYYWLMSNVWTVLHSYGKWHWSPSPSITNGREIKYVHQLQNLYFALTGEELKQKEG